MQGRNDHEQMGISTLPALRTATPVTPPRFCEVLGRPEATPVSRLANSGEGADEGRDESERGFAKKCNHRLHVIAQRATVGCR